MPSSNGDASEKPLNANSEEDRKTLLVKRKRHRNRKRNPPKVENLVSKTFQAKLASTSISETTPDSKETIESSKQTRFMQAGSKITNVLEPNQDILKQNGCSEKDKSKETRAKIKLETSETNNTKQLNSARPSNLEMGQAQMLDENSTEKSRKEILAEREAKKLAKQLAKKKNKEGNVERKDNFLSASSEPKIDPNKSLNEPERTPECCEKNIKENEKKKTSMTKAERRAIQEAQRAAKVEINTKKHQPQVKKDHEDKKTQENSNAEMNIKPEKNDLKPVKDCKVKLFNHLESCRKDSNLFINNVHIHPIMVRLGEQYSKRTIVGSNARCISFLNALKTVIQDYETPQRKEFSRSLETTIKNCVDHLHKCRPLAVSVCNAYKHIKHVLTQLPVEQPESDLKEHLCRFVDTYIENQIEKAAQAISSSVQDKISNGDVILTFGCSSLINYIFEEAHRRHVDFRVIVVDSRPFCEGQELLRRLTAKQIPCTYVLINAVGFVMPEVTKILLGAHALLSNGYVMARTGTAQVALVAHSFNVPVLVCCETHKFSERFQTDAIVYNELGNPDDLIMSDKCRLMNWQAQHKLSPLNLNYDITPPELVTAVVTEVAILPCTSVPVILRIKPTEIGY